MQYPKSIQELIQAFSRLPQLVSAQLQDCIHLLEKIEILVLIWQIN